VGGCPCITGIDQAGCILIIAECSFRILFLQLLHAVRSPNGRKRSQSAFSIDSGHGVNLKNVIGVRRGESESTPILESTLNCGIGMVFCCREGVTERSGGAPSLKQVVAHDGRRQGKRQWRWRLVA